MCPILNSSQRHFEYFSLPLAFSIPVHQALGTVFDKVKLSLLNCDYIHIHEEDQQDAHFFSLICFNYPFKAYRLHGAPTGLTFNNCTFCPHCNYVFCIYLRTSSDLCHLQHKLIGFYNRDGKCLLRGTNWVFK